tara:strand:+ start:153 stop:416 length:264 start_codon:yes stop_codon:yes gene_type:complete
MEDRSKYFLRKPIENQIQILADTMKEMSKEYKEKDGVGIAYEICSIQIQELLTQIKRDDNHLITTLKQAENIKMFEVIDNNFTNKKK